MRIWYSSNILRGLLMIPRGLSVCREVTQWGQQVFLKAAAFLSRWAATSRDQDWQTWETSDWKRALKSRTIWGKTQLERDGYKVVWDNGCSQVQKTSFQKVQKIKNFARCWLTGRLFYTMPCILPKQNLPASSVQLCQSASEKENNASGMIC